MADFYKGNVQHDIFNSLVMSKNRVQSLANYMQNDIGHRLDDGTITVQDLEHYIISMERDFDKFIKDLLSYKAKIKELMSSYVRDAKPKEEGTFDDLGFSL